MTEGYSATPNWMYRDSTVSAHALLVYGALASHSGPGGIHPSQATIAAEARCSERQVRNALNELETLGVVERVRRKNSRGRATNGYELRPHGRLREDEEYASEVAAPDAGTSEVAAHGAGGSGTQRQSIPYIEEEPLKKNPYSPQAIQDAFDALWNVYPRRAGKKTARAAFERAVKAGTSPETILDGARRLRDDPNLPETQYVPHPSTWINREGWEDDPLPARRGSAPKSNAAQAAQYARALEARERGQISA